MSFLGLQLLIMSIVILVSLYSWFSSNDYFLYNIFKCHFNPFIGRHRIQSQANIVLILFTYYIESAHVAGSLICWSLVYVLTLGPMPSILAQLATFLIWSAGNVMFIMGSHISIVKIIFVTQFDWIFCQDPESLGRMALVCSLLVGVVPNCLFWMYHFVFKTNVSLLASYLQGQRSDAENTPMVIYGSSWLLFSILMLILSLVFIPVYVKWNQQAAVVVAENNNNDSMKSISVARVLLGSCGMAVVIIVNLVNIARGETGQVAVQASLEAFFVCLMLMYFNLDINVKRFSMEKFKVTFKTIHNLFVRCNPKINPSPA